MPLFQHRGACDCGSLRFLVLAPKRVEAFDDSNAMSCKKGRFPYLVRLERLVYLCVSLWL